MDFFFKEIICYFQILLHYGPVFCKIDVYVNRDSRGRDGMVDGFTLLVQSVPITTKVVSLIPTHGEVYSILAAGLWFSQTTLSSSTNKTDHHNTTEILLKVALNTINLTSI